MIDGFDELFDMFFGNNKNESSKSKIDDLINRLNNFKDVTGEELNENSELGEPTSIEEYTKNGIIYEKKIWEINGGKIVKIEIKEVKISDAIEIPINIKPTSRFNKASLEDKLQYAIDTENYEEAARLRDEIAKLDNPTSTEPKRRGRPKKK